MKLKNLLLWSAVSFSLTQASLAENLQPYMFGDYRVMDVIEGQLDNQKLEDLILLIKATDEKNLLPDQWDKHIVDKNRRGLVIFFKTDNGYQKIIENTSIFASENEDGGVYFPPDLSIEIKNGLLKFHYGHGRYGDWEYTFRYNPEDGDFDLIGFDSTESNGPITTSITSINFLTGKKKILTNPNPDNESYDVKKFKEKWETFTKPETVKLSQIKDIQNLADEIYNLKKQN